MHRITLSLLLALVLTLPTLAQDACTTLVQQAIETTDANCADIGRNQACYGNLQIDADPSSEDVELNFDVAGDLANVTDIASLRLSGMVTPNEWGIAMMSIQANLPDTVPGQNVTVLLFGDVELNNAYIDSEEYGPMQAFTFKSGIGEPQCNDAPRDGILVQTPQGVATVELLINEVQISLGSTAYLQAQPNQQILIAMLEGQATITINEITRTILAGVQVTIPANADGLPDGELTLDTLDVDNLMGVPVQLLPRDIESPPLLRRYLEEASPRYQTGCNDGNVWIREDDEEMVFIYYEDNLSILVRITETGSVIRASQVEDDVYVTEPLGNNGFIQTYRIISPDEIVLSVDGCGVSGPDIMMTASDS